MENAFESPFKGVLLSEQVTNLNILVGRHSYTRAIATPTASTMTVST